MIRNDPNALTKHRRQPIPPERPLEYTVRVPLNTPDDQMLADWTRTKDNLNSWVSNVHPAGAELGIIVGSTVIALNGKDITDLGHDKQIELVQDAPLPYTVTYARPEHTGTIGWGDFIIVVFNDDPSGMDWTETEDHRNAWVSKVTPESIPAKYGVVQGSMVISINGFDIRDMGYDKIVTMAASMPLPMSISFANPEKSKVPMTAQGLRTQDPWYIECAVCWIHILCFRGIE